MSTRTVGSSRKVNSRQRAQILAQASNLSGQATDAQLIAYARDTLGIQINQSILDRLRKPRKPNGGRKPPCVRRSPCFAT